MNELEIKRHSFDVHKNRLKEFSEKKGTELVIRNVETSGGLFGLGDHKVTGYELNDRLESIQGHLVVLNTTNNKIIKEFREVYKALDALDKDYITSIVANVKAIEKTSNDVREQQKTLKQHNEKLAIQQNKLDTHQTEIDKNVENMKKIVITLKNFKEKLDGFQHLSDIDKIWSDCKTMKNDMEVVSDSIAALAKKSKNDIETANTKNKALLNQVNKEIIDLQKKAKTCMDFFSDLSKKVDSLKVENKKQDEKINGLSEGLTETNDFNQANRNLIEELQFFRNSIDTIEHVSDIDFMWVQGNMLKENLEDANSSILSLKDKTSEMDKDITDKSKETSEKIAVLETKLKYAYYVAGGALGLTVIELILALTGVI